MPRRFLIKLQKAHEDFGWSTYAVAKELGLAYNTVNKYVSSNVISDTLPTQVIQLAEFYGVDWKDPAVVEVIEDSDDTQPITPIDEQIETPLIVPA